MQYSIAQEKKFAKKKVDAEQRTEMQLLLEKEEQARLKVEQELHPDLFNRLNEKTLCKLTSPDLEYRTYLYLTMTTEQIAQALHVAPRSVRMFKYRLKQKFGLGKECVLADFLADIM